MRLIRFDAHPARVSDDIRAALASIGRGVNVVGGVALVGFQPHGTPHPVDAVLVLPKGVLVVVGIDLPEPAMRLDAPLAGQWKADGWPMVRTDNAINPASGALALAGHVAAKVRSVVPSVPVGTIVAVGPYVETIEQPPEDLTGAVRVVYPTSTSMMAASVSLATAEAPCGVAEALAVLRALVPDVDKLAESKDLDSSDGLDDAALLAEGFAGVAVSPNAAEPPTENETTAEAPAMAALTTTEPIAHPGRSRSAQPTTAQGAGPRAQTVAAAPSAPPSSPPAQLPEELTQPLTPFRRQRVGHLPAPPQQPPRRRLGGIPDGRWHAIAAGLALFAVVVAAIVIAATGNGSDDPAGDNAQGPPESPAAPAVADARGLRFTERAVGSDADCVAHAAGDLQVALSEGGCVELRRGSYETTVGDRKVAVSVAWLAFADEADATGFHDLARTPGSGTIADLAMQRNRWPQPTPRFENAAYVTSADGVIVRLVQAVALTGESTPDDRDLIAAAQAATDLELAP